MEALVQYRTLQKEEEKRREMLEKLILIDGTRSGRYFELLVKNIT
jgi:hypothetical protein